MLVEINEHQGHKTYTIYCPGCKETHRINDSWGFDGNLEAPTFTPSILVTNGHYAPQYDGQGCWCTYNEQHPEKHSRFSCQRCHSFVTNGQWQFLDDSTHELKGQTVPMVEVPNAEKE